jgi:hypothetical protein
MNQRRRQQQQATDETEMRNGHKGERGDEDGGVEHVGDECNDRRRDHEHRTKTAGLSDASGVAHTATEFELSRSDVHVAAVLECGVQSGEAQRATFGKTGARRR